MNLAVDCLRRPTSFDQLKNIWQTLERLDPLCSPFLSWTYLSAWWQAVGCNEGELRILIVRRGKEVVALAPLCIQRRKHLGFIPQNTLMIMGTLNGVQSIHQGVIAQPSLRVSACEAIIGHLPTIKPWHTLLLNSLDENSAFAVLARQRILGNRSGANETVSSLRYEVLPESWNEFVGHRKGARLNELSRITQSLEELGKCEFELCSTRKVFRENQRILSELLLSTDGTEESFYSDFIVQGFMADTIWQLVFSLNGRVVGIQHYSIERGELVLLQGCYAPTVKTLGAAKFMFAYALQCGIRRVMNGAHSVVSDDDCANEFLIGNRSVVSIHYTASLWRRMLGPVLNRFVNR
ncbi:MAG: GNAT family N-acetyltransferase [Granulosicoccus sp.]